MMNNFDFDDLTDWLDDNKLTLGMVLCGGLAAVQLFAGGGWNQLQSKLNQDANDSAAIENQARAEKVFRELGCSAQVLDSETRTANLKTGSIVIDPMSITRENPTGTAIASGYVCSLDGSVFQLKDGTAFLIGTSPHIRKELVARGIPQHVKAMEQRANQVYGATQR